MTTKNVNAEAVVVERTLDAPVARVWKALTDVDQMRQWYFDLKEFRPEVGFEFGFVVEHAGNTYDHRCKVTEVIPQRKIAYTWRYEGHEGNSLVTIELAPEGRPDAIEADAQRAGDVPENCGICPREFRERLDRRYWFRAKEVCGER
jgi:uncharacterized protein YndB with AHSA1/START domain